ncbi:MAG: FixH family protein [Betaproteobacteria bacterium]
MTARAMPTPDSATTPWYRQRWPWFLIAGPALVVVAALVTAWIAASGADPVLAEDYYKRGLLVNRTIAAQAAPTAAPSGATLRFGADGTVRARLAGATEVELPPTLRLKLASPSAASGARTVVLVRGADGEYAGRVDALPPGRWIVTLEADAWRLPTTVVSGALADVRLGSTE